jgi:hypothetical protein
MNFARCNRRDVVREAQIVSPACLIPVKLLECRRENCRNLL